MQETEPNPADVSAHVSLSQALRFWLKLGFIGFGGPAGQIAIMHKELVEKKRWISESRFLHALNYCMVLPGPEATQLAIYIGWLLHGTWGGVIAGALFVLPGALLLTILSWLYIVYGAHSAAEGVLFGFKAVVIALILAALVRIGSRAIRSVAALVIAGASFAAITFNALPFPYIILIAGALGWLVGRIHPASFAAPKKSSEHLAGDKPHAPALLDDHTPPPAHAKLSWPRWIVKAVIFALLIGLPPLVLSLTLGFDNVFARMARLFTIAAFVTIGGAYAVLPYIRDMATEVYGWLEPGQMMTGLALGETTPGPLILVLTFVGFVGAWNVSHEQLGFAGALAGATVATYCTFAPSFMFIVLGAPFVEQTRGEVRLGAILSAITAAVVGAIAHMAWDFGSHLFWQNNTVQIAGIVLTVAAVVAMQWKKIDAIYVVLAGGAIGWLFHAMKWA
jgi:chromate transporter